jgi:hypothetical protein
MKEVDVEGYLNGLGLQRVDQLPFVDIAVVVHGGVVRLRVDIAEELERKLLPVTDYGHQIIDEEGARALQEKTKLLDGESLLLSNREQSTSHEDAKRIFWTLREVLKEALRLGKALTRNLGEGIQLPI